MAESKISFRFHVLSLPHTVTTPEYNACAYTMKVLKFCKMMRARGHYIVHYGHKDSVVDADEHVTLLDNDDLLKAYGSYNWRKEFFKHNVNDYANTKFQEVGTVEVLKRLSGAELRDPNDTRKDFVLAFWGIGHGKICEAAKASGKAFICEPGIGYSGSFMDFRVFESYAWMHTTYGEQKISRPSWYHAVIPNYFDSADFHYSPIKSDYYLCLGRINTCKGVQIAIQAAKKLGVKLVLAGQGDIRNDLGISDIPENVIYYGYADVEARKKLMAYAKGFILLSAYIEPFGGAAVEALMAGTPVICPDWGVFNETIPHGLVGYRVRTFDQICWAIKNIDKINPANCRKWAMDNYSLEKVGKMYETYFIQLADVWERGWYQEHPSRTELDWLERTTPDEPPYFRKNDDSFLDSENFNISEISKLSEILEIKKIETQKMYKSDILPVTTLVENITNPKIAIWSESEWAFGRISEALIKYLPNYNFEIFNWTLPERNKFLIENFKNYKYIISNTAIFNPKILIFENLKTDVEFLSKIICISHCPKFNQTRFTESIDGLDREFYKYVKFAAVSKEGVLNFSSTYNIDVSNISWLPCGVDTDDFKESKGFSGNETSKESKGFSGNDLKTLGFIMRDPDNMEARDVKNYTMCQEIANKTQMNMKVISGHSIKEKSKIYENIDMLICCSKYEAGPLGIMEASACGIPVISTKVGNISELSSLKFFSSVEEAVDIINNFKANPEELLSYTKAVSDEVIEKFNWKTLVENYWNPMFENLNTKETSKESFGLSGSEPQELRSKEYLLSKLEVTMKDIPNIPELPIIKKAASPKTTGSKKIASPNSKKIAIWCEKTWAMGRVFTDLIKYMSSDSENSYTFDYLNWCIAEDTNKLRADWESYDLIISNSTIYNSNFKFFTHLYENPKFLAKVLCISHCPLINHPYFCEKIDGLSSEQIQSANLAHVSKLGIQNLKLHYKELFGFSGTESSKELENSPDSEISWLPCGVNLENFKIKERINFPMKNIGFIGRPEKNESSDIKRTSMFQEIISKTKLSPVYIHSRPFTEHDNLYSDIDMLICTSEVEAGPLGIFEAAACGIPVLSTKVGNVSELSSLLTFETVDQAVEIIEYLNTNPSVLQEYLIRVTNEVRNNWSSEILINKYWKPVIDSIIN